MLVLTAEEMEDRGIMHCHSGYTFEPQCTSVEADETGERCFVVNTHPGSGRNFMCDLANASPKWGNAHVKLDLMDFTVDLQC